MSSFTVLYAVVLASSAALATASSRVPISSARPFSTASMPVNVRPVASARTSSTVMSRPSATVWMNVSLIWFTMFW